jgi:hypothetical protein
MTLALSVFMILSIRRRVSAFKGRWSGTMCIALWMQYPILFSIYAMQGDIENKMGLFGLPKIDKLKQRGNREGLSKALDSRYPWKVRVDAALALAELDDDRGRQYFITILSHLKLHKENGNKNSVDAAAALVKKGDKAVNMLSAIFADPGLDSAQHEGAAAVLRMIGSDRSQDAFMNALEQNWEFGRMNMAAKALQEIGSERIVDRLLYYYVADRDDLRRKELSGKILHSIGSIRATECLNRNLNWNEGVTVEDPWTKEDLSYLKQHFRDNTSNLDIAAHLKRSFRDVITKAFGMGLIR